jgi:hypothetical protein
MQRAVVPRLAIARPGIRAPSALAHYFGAVACHRRETPVARLRLAQASHALEEGERARAEVEMLRRLPPCLASLAVPGGEPS